MVMLELGGGMKPHPRADIVIDSRHPRLSPAQDVTSTPWRTGPAGTARSVLAGSVDEVYSSHLMEHIPKGQALINLMNEAWRVLKPGGTFTAVMPIVGWTNKGEVPAWSPNWRPFADPTHVSFWWLPEAFYYFTGQSGPDADYGILRWKPLGGRLPERDTEDLENTTLPDSFWGIRGGWEGVVRLVKP